MSCVYPLIVLKAMSTVRGAPATDSTTERALADSSCSLPYLAIPRSLLSSDAYTLASV